MNSKHISGQANAYLIKERFYSIRTISYQLLITGIITLCYCAFLLYGTLRSLSTQYVDYINLIWMIASGVVGTLSIIRGSTIKKQLHHYNTFEKKKTDNVLASFSLFFSFAFFYIVYYALIRVALSPEVAQRFLVWSTPALFAVTCFAAVWFVFFQKTTGAAVAIGVAFFCSSIAMPDYMDPDLYLMLTLSKYLLSVLLFAVLPFLLPIKKIRGLFGVMLAASFLSSLSYIVSQNLMTNSIYGYSETPVFSGTFFYFIVVLLPSATLFVLLCWKRVCKTAGASKPHEQKDAPATNAQKQKVGMSAISNVDQAPSYVPKATAARPKFCRMCGSKLSDDGLFCQNCGAKIAFPKHVVGNQETKAVTPYVPETCDPIAEIMNSSEFTAAYAILSADQKKDFFVFPDYKLDAARVVHSMRQLINVSVSIRQIFEIYVSICSRLLLFHMPPERISVTLKLRYSDVLNDEQQYDAIAFAEAHTNGMNQGFYIKDRSDLTKIKKMAQAIQESIHAEKTVSAASDYGYSKENPIVVESIPAEYAYLNKLRYDSGEIIGIRRVAAVDNSRREALDMFSITVKEAGVEKNISLFLNGYGDKPSTIAPQGFHL